LSTSKTGEARSSNGRHCSREGVGYFYIFRTPSVLFGTDESHKWIPEPKIVAEAVAALKLAIVAKDDGPDGMMSFFICAEKL
jgi:hypothetical protein